MREYPDPNYKGWRAWIAFPWEKRTGGLYYIFWSYMIIHVGFISFGLTTLLLLKLGFIK